MARVVGIDIRADRIRAALLRTSYKRVTVDNLVEVELAHFATQAEALQACAAPLLQHGESLAVSIDGDQAFVHNLTLPLTARKQLAEVLPFEIEAQIPVDIDELVYDWREQKHPSGSPNLRVLTAAARIETVRSLIDKVAEVLGREPERVGVGPMPLANLTAVLPNLAEHGAIALVDLGAERSEVLIAVGGEPAFARTVSRGVRGLPATASALARELRQTLVAWLANGGADVSVIYLLGGGAEAPGAANYLASELRMRVAALPPLALDELPEEHRTRIPRFAKAIALSLGLAGRSRDLDLRRAGLAYQRGYGFLKEKIPLLVGLIAAIVVSFAFATWAEMKALTRDQEVLEKSLAGLTKDVLGEEVTDPEEAISLLERAQSKREENPMPHMDAFGVMVEISNAIPISMTHDIEEFDMARGHVKINGVVGSTQDAQKIQKALKEARCLKKVRTSKFTQVINSDRQKYVLEFDVRCPEDSTSKSKKDKREEP